MSARVSRRRFVVGSLSLPAVALAGGAVVDGAAARIARRDPSMGSWRAVRAQFRLDPKLTHFASFILASHPKPVRRSIAKHRAALDADPYTYESASSFAASRRWPPRRRRTSAPTPT